MKQQKKLGMLLAASAAAIFATGCHQMGMSSMYHDGQGHHAHGCNKNKAHGCNHSAKDRASCKSAKDRAACKTSQMKSDHHMCGSNGCNH